MTIKDLKPGYVVVCRNERAYVICETDSGELYGVRNSGRFVWLNGGALTHDLKSQLHTPEWDICAVYGRPIYPGSCLTPATEDRKLLWKRKEAKKMTVKQICEALGYDVEIVKED